MNLTDTIFRSILALLALLYFSLIVLCVAGAAIAIEEFQGEPEDLLILIFLSISFLVICAATILSALPEKSTKQGISRKAFQIGGHLFAVILLGAAIFETGFFNQHVFVLVLIPLTVHTLAIARTIKP